MAKILTFDGLTVYDLFNNLSEGNPGALTALAEVWKCHNATDPDNALGQIGCLLMFDTFEIYGPAIWVLYKDVCRQSAPRLIGLLRAVQLGLLSEETLREVAYQRSWGQNLLTPEHVDNLILSVSSQLPSFVPPPPLCEKEA